MSIIYGEPGHVETDKLFDRGTVVNPSDKRDANKEEWNCDNVAVKAHEQSVIEYDWKNEIRERKDRPLESPQEYGHTQCEQKNVNTDKYLFHYER
jgi:hypothetical protein